MLLRSDAIFSCKGAVSISGDNYCIYIEVTHAII